MDDIDYQILSQLRHNVISKMRVFVDINNERFFSDYELSQLSKIEVSFLTKNSISRHGLTTNLDKSKKISPSNCKVRLNRKLFEEKYSLYAEFVLYHEYIHCLGNFSHDKNFRQLENLWPNVEKMSIFGRQLTRELQENNSQWAWTCSKCGFIVKRSTRKFRSNYFHKECLGKLENIPIIRPTSLEH